MLQDISLTDLSDEMRKALSRTDWTWFSSFGFCSGYSEPPAQRAWIWCEEKGNLLGGCCYREKSLWGGLLKGLHIFGPVQLSSAQIRGLMRGQDAQLARIDRMGSVEVSLWGDDPFYVSHVSRTSEDMVIELPVLKEAYLNSLGKNARKQLPYYLRRLKKECEDGIEIICASGPEITQKMIDDLVSLNRERLSRKGIRHLWSEDLKRRRWLLAQEDGFFFGLQYREHLLSGVLSYVYPNEAYMVLIGHDRRHDSLRLGKLTLWLTIERLIEQGIRRYHLLWGRHSYKYQLGGIEHPLYEVHVFSNAYVAILWHLNLAWQKGMRRVLGFFRRAAQSFLRLLRLRSNETEQEQKNMKCITRAGE
jgi:hypothetical protein